MKTWIWKLASCFDLLREALMAVDELARLRRARDCPADLRRCAGVAVERVEP